MTTLKSLIRIDAPITPVPFKRVQSNGKQRFNDKCYSQFKDELGYFALNAMKGQEPLQGLLQLSAHFYKKYRKVGTQGYGDCDNFLKSVMDALQGICYVNDAQIIEIHGFKHFDKNPRIEIELEEF